MSGNDREVRIFPFVLRDKDGRVCLYYVGAGEKTVGVAFFLEK